MDIFGEGYFRKKIIRIYTQCWSKKEWMRVCVCVCVREREREREWRKMHELWIFVNGYMLRSIYAKVSPYK